MSDRIFGAVALLISLTMLWASSQIEESFIQDPLGPKAFPIGVAIVMGLAGLAMMLRPDVDPNWPTVRKAIELVATLGVMVTYAYLLPVMGFVLSTAGLTAFLCWCLGATVRQSATGGVLITLLIYGVFQHILGLNLARGPWGF